MDKNIKVVKAVREDNQFSLLKITIVKIKIQKKKMEETDLLVFYKLVPTRQNQI